MSWTVGSKAKLYEKIIGSESYHAIRALLKADCMTLERDVAILKDALDKYTALTQREDLQILAELQDKRKTLKYLYFLRTHVWLLT